MKRKHTPKRKAFTVMELGVAVILLMAVLALFAALVVNTSEERLTQRMRTIAVDELQNVFERIDPEELKTPQPEKEAGLAAVVKNALPDGTLKFERFLLSLGDGREAPALRAVVSWDNGAGRPRPELSIVRILEGQR